LTKLPVSRFAMFMVIVKGVLASMLASIVGKENFELG